MALETMTTTSNFNEYQFTHPKTCFITPFQWRRPPLSIYDKINSNLSQTSPNSAYVSENKHMTKFGRI